MITRNRFRVWDGEPIRWFSLTPMQAKRLGLTLILRARDAKDAMDTNRTEEEAEMMKREADDAREPRRQDLERIEELGAEVERLRNTLKKCYRGFDHIHDVAVETPVRQDAIQGKAEIQRLMDTSELPLAEDGQDE